MCSYNCELIGGNSMKTENGNQEIEVEIYLVSDIQKKLRCSKNKAYEIVKKGYSERLFSVIKIGNEYRISRKSFDFWLDNQHLMNRNQ